MNNYSDLISQKKYDEVIKLAKEDASPSAVFALASAYLAKGDKENGVKAMDSHLDQIFDAFPLKTIKFYFEALFIIEDFDKAFDMVAYFQNKPYVSQEVEEALKELPNRVRTAEKLSLLDKKPDQDTIKKWLSGTAPFLVLSGLSLVTEESFPFFEPYIELLCRKEEIHDDLRTYAFIDLKSHGYDKEVTLIKGGKKYSLVPSKTKAPFDSPSFIQAKKLLSNSKNPSLSAKAKDLLEYAFFASYPDESLGGYSPETLSSASLFLASSYLGEKTSIKDFLLSPKDLPSAQKAFEEIKRLNESSEPLAL